MDTRTKILSASEVRPEGVLAYGRFDVLTAEHCRLLASARDRSSALTAMIEADPADPPAVLDAQARAHLTAALGSVDRVIICDQPERERLLAKWDAEAVVDVESQVHRDVVADVLSRHSDAPASTD